ncbi:MAG: YbaY family lipoprotein [Betaproteobacteria bacterium]|nr:YbaY family lipoprotein [Betaproteobacteria bacterium]
MRSNSITGGRRPMTRALLATCLAWLACGAAWAGTLEGTAAYRERIALPPDAVFEAELQDVSKADAPAVVLGRARLDPAGQPPFRFAIAYDDAAVKAGRRYTVRATVRHQGQLMFTTDTHTPVLDGRNAPLELLLVSARGGAKPKPKPAAAAIGTLPASYEGELPGASNPIAWHLDLMPQGRYQLRMTHVGRPEPNRFDDIGRWMQERDTGRIVLRSAREARVHLMPVDGGAALRKLDTAGKPIESSHNDRLARLPKFAPIEPRMALTGMFRYMADAAGITLCADGRRLPVAMEADFRALEAAYRQSGTKPGQPVLVSVNGAIAQRPSMEESQPPRPTLVVERFVNVWPRETCGNTLADSPLRGTYWKLVRLGDAPVPAGARQREAHLMLASDALRVSGSGGCNRLAGGFELDGDKLRFSRVAGTMMACGEGMEQETRFLDALGQVESYRVRGSHLELMDAQGVPRARFEAVAMK